MVLEMLVAILRPYAIALERLKCSIREHRLKVTDLLLLRHVQV